MNHVDRFPEINWCDKCGQLPAKKTVEKTALGFEIGERDVCEDCADSDANSAGGDECS